MTHFLYGFILVTLLYQLWGQFPSSGHPMKSLATQFSCLLPLLVLS